MATRTNARKALAAAMVAIPLAALLGACDRSASARRDTSAEATAIMSFGGVFSDVASEPESGDVVGTEVELVPAGTGLRATVQRALGEPMPLLRRDARVVGGEVQFDLPPDSGVEIAGGVERPVELAPARRFRGRLVGDTLVATIEGEPDTLRLTRRSRALRP